MATNQPLMDSDSVCVTPLPLPHFLANSQTVEELDGMEYHKTAGSDGPKGLFVVCNHGST